MPEMTINAPAIKTRGTSVKMFATCVIAIILTTITCFAIMPLKNATPGGHLFRLWEICLDRGPVSPGTIWLSYWAIVILLFKYQKVLKQRRSLAIDILPVSIGERINKSNLDAFIKHTSSVPFQPGESEFIDRIRGALEHFKARDSRDEVELYLTTQKELDGNALTQSYTMLNVLSWAIPILGFIGTVQGIAVAVSSFQRTIEAASELGVLKQSLSGVTYGLAIAFDTTLIGLILSLVVVFPAKMMEKSEEDTHSLIEDMTSDQLLKRLDESGQRKTEAEEDRSKDWVKNAVAAAMAKQEAEFAMWTKHLEKVGTTLTQRAMEGWDMIDKRLRETHNKQVDEVKGLQATQAKQFSDIVTSLNETVSKTQAQITVLQENQLKGYKDTVASLSTNLQSLQEQAAKRSQDDAEKLGTMASEFADSLKQLQNQAAQEQGEWTKYFKNIGDAITERVVAGWQSIDEKLRESLGHQLVGIQGVGATIAGEQKAFSEQIRTATGSFQSMQEQVTQRSKADTDILKQMATGFAETLKKLQEQAAAVQDGFKNQAAAAQAEWTRHFDNIGASVTKRVVDGWEAIDQKLRDAQAQQIQQLREAVSSVNETASRVARQVADLQEKHVDGLRESVTTLSSNLQNIQGQAKEMQEDLTESMRSAGPVLRDEVRQVLTSVGESFREQLKSLDQVKQAVDNSAQKFIGRLEDIRQMHSQSLQETMSTLRESARTIQKDIATNQEQPLNRLQEVAQSMAEQARNIQREMETARESMREEARKAADQFNRSREEATRAATEQMSQLSSNAERMLSSLNQATDKSIGMLGQATEKTMSSLSQASDRTMNSLSQAMEKVIGSLSKTIETAQERIGGLETSRRSLAEQEISALKSEREAAERTATENLSKATAAVNQLMNSMGDAQRKMTEQIQSLVNMLESQDKLANLQKVMASNLEILATSDTFKKTLSGIDQGLNRLQPVLKDLSDKAGIAWSESGGDGGGEIAPAGGRKWRLWGKKG